MRKLLRDPRMAFTRGVLVLVGVLVALAVVEAAFTTDVLDLHAPSHVLDDRGRATATAASRRRRSLAFFAKTSVGADADASSEDSATQERQEDGDGSASEDEEGEFQLVDNNAPAAAETAPEDGGVVEDDVLSNMPDESALGIDDEASEPTTPSNDLQVTRLANATISKGVLAAAKARAQILQRQAAQAKARAKAPRSSVKGKGTLAKLTGKYAQPTSGVDGQKCDGKCPGRLLCNRPLQQRGKGKGVCRCPIMFSGDKKCTTPPKKTPSWCGMNMHSTKLTQLAELGDRFNRMQSVGVGMGMRNRILTGKNDLGQMADWSSCAVVGSSGGLLKQRAGLAIDKHAAVIRFNEAPTKKFERHVGSKTTLRLQNYDHCGFSEGSELCMQYSLTGQTHKCLDKWLKRGKCKVIKPSRRLQSYVQGYWMLARPNNVKPNWIPAREPPHKLSAGFFGIMLAMHLCAKVSVYGFTQSPLGHYFKKEKKNKGFSKGRNVLKRHFWEGERACLSALKNTKTIPVGVA